MGQADRSLQVAVATPAARTTGFRHQSRASGCSQAVHRGDLPRASAQFVTLVFDLDDVALELLVVGATQIDELQPDSPLRHAGAEFQRRHVPYDRLNQDLVSLGR